MSKKDKIRKAKDIIAAIYSLTVVVGDHKPRGYGNFELDKATDAMYAYIKTVEDHS